MTTKNLKLRLRELAESTEYQKDFEKLKKSILENPATLDSILPPLPLKEIQEATVWILALLKEGNINDYHIGIPIVFFEFQAKYGLALLFDPTRPYHTRPYHGFNPFFYLPIRVLHRSADQILGKSTVEKLIAVYTKPTYVFMAVDINYPSPILEREFKAEIKSAKWKLGLKEGRRERISEDEIFQVKRLREAGLSDIEIFYMIYPQYKGEIGRGHSINCDAIAAHERVKRLIKKAKELKS